MSEFDMIYARKINKMPEFCMIFFTEFWGRVLPPPPPPVSHAHAYTWNLFAQKDTSGDTLVQLQTAISGVGSNKEISIH